MAIRKTLPPVPAPLPPPPPAPKPISDQEAQTLTREFIESFFGQGGGGVLPSPVADENFIYQTAYVKNDGATTTAWVPQILSDKGADIIYAFSTGSCKVSVAAVNVAAGATGLTVAPPLQLPSAAFGHQVHVHLPKGATVYVFGTNGVEVMLTVRIWLDTPSTT